MFADKNRHRLAQIAIGVVILLAILPYFRPVAPLIIEETVGDSTVTIEADYSWMLFEGRCMDVRWELEGIAGVYVQDLQPERGTVGIGELRDCYAPAFSLRVIFPDETTTIYPLDVQYGYQQTHWQIYYVLLAIIGLISTSIAFYRGADAVDTRYRVGTGMLIACLPLVILIGMLETRTTHDGNICDKRLEWSDEIYYWAQASTFADVGFGGGYYTVNEIPPPMVQSPFYGWGWGPPVLYGTVASIVPWNYCTPILFNAFILGLAVVSFTAFVPLTRLQLAWSAILMATFPSLVLYMPAFMMQVLNLSLATMLAILFYRAFSADSPLTPRAVFYVALGIVLASLLRVTWSFLFVPLFFCYGIQQFSWRRFILSMGLSVLLVGLAFTWHVITVAPFPNGIAENVDQVSNSALAGISGFVDNMLAYLRSFFSGNNAQRGMRTQIVMVIIVGIVFFIKQWRDSDAPQAERWFAILHVMNAGSIFALILITYSTLNWGDFRLLAPHIFLSIVLLIAQGKHNTILLFIAVWLISWTGYQFLYDDILNRHFDPQRESFAEVATYEAQYEALGVVYRPDVPSRWCNTVLISTNYVTAAHILHGFDDGLGLSLILLSPGANGDVLATQPQSAYLLIEDNLTLPEHIQVEPLGDVPSGKLYRNTAVDCPLPTNDNN